MISALKEKTIECSFLLSPFIHTTRRGHVSTQWGGSAHKPREEAQHETYPIAHTLIQDFQPAECEQRQSCCLSQEVCRNLCWQGLPTKTMCYSWKECQGSLTKENYQLFPENFALRQSRICPFSSRLRILWIHILGHPFKMCTIICDAHEHTQCYSRARRVHKKHRQWFPIIKAARVIKNMKLVNIFIQDKILLQSHRDIASILSTGGL